MAVFELMPSVLTQWLIDDALGKKNLSLLYVLAGALLALLLARTASHTARMIFLGKLAQLVLYQLRTRLYEHLQKLSMSFYQNKRTGQIMSRVTSDVNVIEQFVVEVIRDGVVNVLKLVFIAIILVTTNWQLALITLLPTAPLAWGTKEFSKRVRAGYRTMRRRMADMNSILSDTIGGIRVVQVFGQEKPKPKSFAPSRSTFSKPGCSPIDCRRFSIPV
jgi:ABC-type bacteriocin/lantibiotic exporter with double-glycine peptidase domain